MLLSWTRISGCVTPFHSSFFRGIWGGPVAPDCDGDGWTMSQKSYVPNFSFLHWIKRYKEPPCSRSPWLELCRTLEVPDWGFSSWSWWGWVYNVPNYLCSEIQLSTLNKKVQRTPMSSKSWSWVLEDSGGFWPEFWFLIIMGMGLQCTKLPMFRNSAFYIE